MNDIEYAKFIVTDTVKQLTRAFAIYGVALTAYWTFVG
jgi:hypothetical protein